MRVREWIEMFIAFGDDDSKREQFTKERPDFWLPITNKALSYEQYNMKKVESK